MTPKIDPNDPDRKKALNCLAEMKRLRPDMVSDARKLWRPELYGGDRTENDLEIFRDDPDFERLLAG